MQHESLVILGTLYCCLIAHFRSETTGTASNYNA
jgi:hypothetical protein